MKTTTTDERGPWVIVAGGFHARGGMDKANAALAARLLARGHTVHMIAHAVSEELAAHARAEVLIVPRPAGSTLAGEGLLAREGRRRARALAAASGGARPRVVVNGGNCLWADANWVHSVHHAWPPRDEGAPLWFRAKNRLTNALARRRERRAVRAARVVVCNSERTRRDVIAHLGVAPDRVRVVALGTDASCARASDEERREARARLGVGQRGAPVVAFVGALGHDHNKGFDTLWRAWQALSARGGWDAELLVAGGGRGVGAWRERVGRSRAGERVRLIGFTERVEEVYAAADLLVSPVRYEAYGLNVHEAVCRGAAALVSARAGVAEVFTDDLSGMLLPDPEDSGDLAARLLKWRSDAEGWRRRFAPLAARLAARTWEDVAADFIAEVESDQQSALSTQPQESDPESAADTRTTASAVS